MARKFTALLLFALLALAPLAQAQEGAALQVEEMEFATGIENRVPVGVAASFAVTVGKIYCYTKIVGAAEPTTVSHAWYFNGEEMAKVELAVNGPSWRTWSSKEMEGTGAGAWRVDVVSAAGDVLASKEFTVTQDGM